MMSADMGVELNSAVTIAWMRPKCKMYMKNFGEFFKIRLKMRGQLF